LRKEDDIASTSKEYKLRTAKSKEEGTMASVIEDKGGFGESNQVEKARQNSRTNGNVVILLCT